MATAALNVGFGTPFQAQIDFLRQKLGVPTERWDDIQRAAHDRAFVVAGAAKADLLADLQQAVVKAAEEGAGLQAFRKDFKGIVAKHGWTGWTGEDTPAGVAWRTRVIYQTNMATSYAAGRHAQMSDPEVLKLRPYWRYLHSDGVMTPRPLHLAWHGLTLRHDHPFWKTHYPPCGWGCQCRVTSVSRLEGEASARAGLDEPPAGWDKINPRTGAPAGIDKGFDYAPGASLQEEARRLIAAKAEKLPKVLGKALLDDTRAILDRPVFVEAKTAKAAGEWAMKNNLVDFADYAGIKPEVANAWNKSLFDHLQEFPELRANQKFTGTCQAQFARWREIEIERYVERLRLNNPQLPAGFDFKSIAEKAVKPMKVSEKYAHSWTQPDVSGVAVNKKYGADPGLFEQLLKRDVSQKWHPIGADTIRSVVDHELGHQLDALLGLQFDSEVVSAYKAAQLKGIKDEVSGYAAKNIKEYIAECWAEICNNPAPRADARAIGEIVRARYQSKFGSARPTGPSPV